MYAYPTQTPSDGRMHRPSTAGPSQPGVWKRGVVGGAKLAPWHWRLASGAIDYGGLWLILEMFAAVHVVALGWMVMLGALGFNNIYMQGTTGQSLGKRVVGTRVAAAVKAADGSLLLVYPGIGRCLLRQCAHFVDYIVVFIGFIRPLWQRWYRTWADSIAKTVVLSRDCPMTLEERPEGSVRLEGF